MYLERWCEFGLELYNPDCPNSDSGDCTTCHQYGGLWVQNLTPHAITIQREDGTQVTVSPSGTVARVNEIRTEQVPLYGIRIVRTDKGPVENLPAPKTDVVYLVSSIVLDALKGTRYDTYAPDTGADAVRNDKGHIVAVRGLRQ